MGCGWSRRHWSPSAGRTTREPRPTSPGSAADTSGSRRASNSPSSITPPTSSPMTHRPQSRPSHSTGSTGPTAEGCRDDDPRPGSRRARSPACRPGLGAERGHRFDSTCSRLHPACPCGSATRDAQDVRRDRRSTSGGDEHELVPGSVGRVAHPRRPGSPPQSVSPRHRLARGNGASMMWGRRCRPGR